MLSARNAYAPRVVVLIGHLRRPDTPSQLAQVVQRMLPAVATAARVRIIDAALSEILSVAGELVKSNEVDVFVCAHATAPFLRKQLAVPVVPMRVGARDLLRGLDQARVLSPAVAILSYREVIADLNEMGPLFTVRIRQGAYTTLKEVGDQVRQMVADGYCAIIGSSSVVELAEEAGVAGVLAPTAEAVEKAGLCHIRTRNSWQVLRLPARMPPATT